MRSAIHFWLRRAQTERQKTLVSADSIFIDTAQQLRRIYYFARVSLDNVLRFFSFFFLAQVFPLSHRRLHETSVPFAK